MDWETIKNIGAVLSCVLSFVAVFGMIKATTKSKIREMSGTDEIKDAISRLENKVDEQADSINAIKLGSQANARNNILNLVDKCLAKDCITSIEKMNLKDMYTAYHELGGDTYCTARYELALELREV